MTATAPSRSKGGCIPAAASSESLKDEYTVRPRYNAGDVHLRTVDKYEIRVNHVHLINASTVMRDSWTLRSDPKEPMILELSDDFEDCDLVECVLDLLTGRDTLPPDCISDYDMDRCKNLYYFARKWDCPLLTYILRLYLSDLVGREEETCDDVFILGAVMEDDDLRARAIAAYDDGELSCDGGGLVGHLEGSFMKPSYWSLARYMMCPPAYTWALQRVIERHEARRRRKKSGTGGARAGADHHCRRCLWKSCRHTEVKHVPQTLIAASLPTSQKS